MTGLRDRKKQEIRHRIIGAAAKLFAQHGIDQTTIEDIATAADVSPGTVYNYFGTKSALLLAGVEEDTDRMVAAGQTILEDPDPDPLDAVKRLSHIYLDELTKWDDRLLRELMAAALEPIDDDGMTAGLARQDQRLIEQMMELLSHYHARGQLARGVDLLDAVMVIFSVFFLQLIMSLNLELGGVADLQGQVDRQIELVFTGIGRESE